MSKLDQFPKADNTPAGKEARLAKLLKAQRERELSGIFKKFHPLIQKIRSLEFVDPEEQKILLQKLSETIESLLSLNPFGKDLELKKECQEVLHLLKDKNLNQTKRYSRLMSKLFNFFLDNNIVVQELP